MQAGSYLFGRRIGDGAFGEVKLAYHLINEVDVAIKCFHRGPNDEEKNAKVQAREVKIFQTLCHPNVLRLYEVIETNSSLFLVMPFASNASSNHELFEYIIENPNIPDGQARLFFQQIISAVGYCHHMNIAHRDLKPENILLGESNIIKLADFGLSKNIEDGVFLRTNLGTPDYAAPELILEHHYSGALTDVWACGVVLYAILRNALPFHQDTKIKTFKKILQGSYYKPPSFSPLVKNLLPQMLNIEPSKRITIEEIRRHPWFKLDLPSYLSKPFAEQGRLQGDAIDIEIVHRIMEQVSDFEKTAPANEFTLSISKTITYMKRTKLQGILKAIQCDKNNDIQTMYRIYHDQKLSKRIIEQALASRSTQPTNLTQTNAKFYEDTENSQGYFQNQYNSGEKAEISVDFGSGLDYTERFHSAHSMNTLTQTPLAPDSNAFFTQRRRSVSLDAIPDNVPTDQGAMRSRNGLIQRPRIFIDPKDIKRRKWLLGCETRTDAKEMIHKIFYVLKALGCESYIEATNPYAVDVRWRKVDGPHNFVYLTLRLYLIPNSFEQVQRKQRCLLEFYRTGGISSSVRFLQLGNLIINGLLRTRRI